MSTPTPTEPATPTKPWYQSKTIWLNGLVTVIGVATFFAEPKNDPVLTTSSIAAAIAGASNVVLRVWFTNTAIG